MCNVSLPAMMNWILHTARGAVMIHRKIMHWAISDRACSRSEQMGQISWCAPPPGSITSIVNTDPKHDSVCDLSIHRSHMLLWEDPGSRSRREGRFYVSLFFFSNAVHSFLCPASQNALLPRPISSQNWRYLALKTCWAFQRRTASLMLSYI